METVGYQDIEIECNICHGKFIWARGEQHFYHEKGLTQPRKCPACREDLKRKIHRQNEERAMKEAHND